MYVKNLFKHWTYQIFSPGNLLKEKYDAFRSLLSYDKCAHELMADLEEIYHNQIKVDFGAVEQKYNDFSHCVSQMIEMLCRMNPSRYLDLRDYFKKLDSYARYMLEPPEHNSSPPHTVQLRAIPADAQTLVGGKAMNLGIIGRNLKLPVPEGFVITGNAFYYFMEFNNLREYFDERLSKLDIKSTVSLDETSRDLMERIRNARIPPKTEKAVVDAIESFPKTKEKDIKLAMRSSALGEDTRASFAGQYRTVLNVSRGNVLDAYREVLASKYAPSALYYRINYGLSDVETPMAVIALKMIDAVASGIVYTEDLDDPDANRITIHSIWGLGELLVGGNASPDVIKVAKGRSPEILQRKVAVKTQQMMLSSFGHNEIVPLGNDKKHTISLDDKAALILGQWGMRLETHFGEPQDVEWCMDPTGNLYILQSRPLKAEPIETEPLECNFEDIMNPVLISDGEKACGGIGAGKVFMIEREADLESLPSGAVLVARNAAPQYVKVMDRLSAVVTDLGSTAGHFSSVAREFGVPSLLNTGNATALLPQGKEVTVYADGRLVYDGIVHSMLESPCARRDLLSGSPFATKLRYLMDFVSPLKLVDPRAVSFAQGEVRSLHDIIRFCHEKAVQEMFHMGDKRVRKIGGAKKLVSSIPMLFYVLDVGGGLADSVADQKEVRFNDISSTPMAAVLRGLAHPDIQWGEFTHFDWAEFDKIVMSGGIISPESAIFASYAVLSADYLNLNLRFGYHFVILDTLCGDRPADNYILFRFAGGAADLFKRSLRADFLTGVLQRLGFEVFKKGDLVDAQLSEETREVMERKLDQIGRLLGATRLMDMYLKDPKMAESYVEDFLNGRYHFATVQDSDS